MQSLEAIVGQLFVNAIKTSFPALAAVKPLITPGRDLASGEFQCNNALQLPKLLKAANVADAPKSPQEVGQCIVKNLPENNVIADTVVAPQGFINIKIAKKYVADQLYDILQDGLKPPPQKKQVPSVGAGGGRAGGRCTPSFLYCGLCVSTALCV